MPFELLLCLLVVKNYKYKRGVLHVITAKQTAIRTFMYCNHSAKTNHHHVHVSSVLLSVVHVAVSGMIVFLCNESESAMRVRKVK